jgi:hypothetical protein
VTDRRADGVTRRQFLAGAGTAVATETVGAHPVGATAEDPPARGPGTAPDPTELDHLEARHIQSIRRNLPEPSADRADVVRGVADLGLDPTGQDPVDGEIQAAADRGDLVTLPPGDYLFASTVTTSADGWGIAGQGDAVQDVRLHSRGNREIIDTSGGRNLRFANFALVNGRNGEVGTTLHDRRGGPRGCGINVTVEDGAEFRNIHHIGVTPREGLTGDNEQFNDQTGSLIINVTDPDGAAVVENVRIASPTEVSGHAENDGLLQSWSQHRGIVYVRGSLIANGGGDGATYLSRTAGGWRFTDCTFRQNYASSLRLGGGVSWVRRCTILVDGTNDTTNNILAELQRIGNKPKQHPIVWESSSSMTDAASGRAGGLVDGCEILMRSVHGSRGGIAVDGSAGGLVVRNTRVENHTDEPCLSVDAPGSSFMNDYETPAGPHSVFLKNLELVGSGSGAAITAEGRRVVGRGVSISMPNGGDVEGATLEGRERPGFVGDLLALQGDVPAPAEAIGASGGVGLGGAARTILAAGGGAVLLLAALAALPALALFSYLLE